MKKNRNNMKRLNVSIEEEIDLILGLMKNKKKKSELVNKSLIFFLKDEENLKFFFDNGAIKIIKFILASLENKEKNAADDLKKIIENSEIKEEKLKNKIEEKIKKDRKNKEISFDEEGEKKIDIKW